MCPPPSDPLWPIGPTLGQVYVPRAEHPERVHRRRRHEEDTDEQRRRRQHGHHEPGAAGDTWIGPEAELDAGTYDDHGRASHRDDDDPPTRLHIDAVA